MELKELTFKSWEDLYDEYLFENTSIFNDEETFIPSTLADYQFEGFTFDKILPENSKKGIRYTSEQGRDVLDFTSSSMLKLGRMFMNRYSFISFFESIVDTSGGLATGAWDILCTIIAGTPGISAGMGNVQLDTKNTNGNTVEIKANPTDAVINFSKNPAFEVEAKFSAITNQTAYMTMGANQSSPAFAGFKVVNGTLSAAFTNSAGTEKLSTISGITLTNYNRYRVIMTNSSCIEWYINDVFKCSAIQIGSNITFGGSDIGANTLPTGAGTCPADFYIATAANESKQLNLIYTTFSQDD